MTDPFSPLGLDVRVWNGVEIQRRPSDGYVNATAMCKANGKQWNHYASNGRTKTYLKTLRGQMAAESDCGTAVPGFPGTGNHLDPVQVIQGGPPELQGTWVHPLVAVDLACWLHPAFALWMHSWFLEAAEAQRSPQPTAAPVAPAPAPAAATPGPRIAFAAPEAWSDLVDQYMADVEAENADVPLAERRRSMRFARPLAQHMLQWLINNHTQLVLPGITGPALAPVAPPAPPHPAPAAPPWRPSPAPQPAVALQGHLHPIWDDDTTPKWEPRRRNSNVVARQRLLGQHYPAGYRIAAPELANLLGISSTALNSWARSHGAGAERDGWRLIGQGKIGVGKLGAAIPPGKSSWIFERL